MRVNRATYAVLLVATSVGLASCGSEERVASAEPVPCRHLKAATGEYLTSLCEFRSAAAAGRIYDAYGFAEYFPKPQRAAIHAYCFVADRMLEDGEFERLADSTYLTARITRKAEADLKAELDIVAPRPTREAIDKLESILDLDSLDRDLAERYVKACY